MGISKEGSQAENIFAFLTVQLVIFGPVLWFVYRGAGWSRWVLGALTVPSIFVLPVDIITITGQVIGVATIVILFFTPSAKEHFGIGKAGKMDKRPGYRRPIILAVAAVVLKLSIKPMAESFAPASGGSGGFTGFVDGMSRQQDIANIRGVGEVVVILMLIGAIVWAVRIRGKRKDLDNSSLEQDSSETGSDMGGSS